MRHITTFVFALTLTLALAVPVATEVPGDGIPMLEILKDQPNIGPYSDPNG